MAESDPPSRSCPGPEDPSVSSHDPEASQLAALCRNSLSLLLTHQPEFDAKHAYTAADILALPFSSVRLADTLADLPRRKSRHRARLAHEISWLVYPTHERSLAAPIRYEEDRVVLRAWVVLQRNYDVLVARAPPGAASSEVGLAARVARQGPWDPARHPVALEGLPAVMPLKRPAHWTEVYPVLDMVAACQSMPLLNHPSRVAFDGSRLDLCRIVCGAEHVPRVLATVQRNPFIRRVLLANNQIGPVGAAAIAGFVRTFPERIDAWYLPGNQLTCASLSLLLPSLVAVPAASMLTGLWLQKNPLKPESAAALAQFIVSAPHLRTLDVSTTELGDRGVAQFFCLLADHVTQTAATLPLRNVFLSGNGVSVASCVQIARLLAAGPVGHGLTGLYLSCNPLGDEGAAALAYGIARAPQLARLLLQSTGLTAAGAMAVCDALTGHAGIRALDLGQSFAAQEQKLPLNYINDRAVPSITAMLVAGHMQYFVLGSCALSERGAQLVYETTSKSQLLFLHADTIESRNGLNSDLAAEIGPEKTIVPSQQDFLDGLGSVAAAPPPPPQKKKTEAEKAAFKRMAANVRAVYGRDMSYSDFKEHHKKWLVSDGEGFGQIDNKTQRVPGV